MRVCVLQDKEDEETLLVRPRTTYLALSENLDRPETRRVVEGDHLEYQSSIPELLHKRAQEGRGHLSHPNKIHSEKAWTFLKMASTAIKVWFGQSKRATLFEGTCFKILLLIFCVFFRNSFPRLCGKVTSTLACEVNFYLTKVRSFVSNRVKQLIDFLPHFFDTQSVSLNDVSSCFFVKLNNHNLDT